MVWKSDRLAVPTSGPKGLLLQPAGAARPGEDPPARLQALADRRRTNRELVKSEDKEHEGEARRRPRRKALGGKSRRDVTADLHVLGLRGHSGKGQGQPGISRQTKSEQVCCQQTSLQPKSRQFFREEEHSPRQKREDNRTAKS